MTARDIIQGYGGPAKLARALGLEPALVWRWQERGIPASRVGRVSALTGRPPHVIRPDLFDAPDPDAVEVANDEARRRGDVGTHAPVRHDRLPEAA